jgi:hypothetical protein
VCHAAFSHLGNNSLREGPLNPPEFDRNETLVCMALAFCLAGASTSIIYRLLG